MRISATRLRIGLELSARNGLPTANRIGSEPTIWFNAISVLIVPGIKTASMTWITPLAAVISDWVTRLS